MIYIPKERRGNMNERINVDQSKSTFEKVNQNYSNREQHRLPPLISPSIPYYSKYKENGTIHMGS
jgi:hypothetical protein